MPPSATVEHVSEIPANLMRNLIKTDEFDITAKSRTEQLPRLFDDDLSSYYQTNSSCPHTVTITFKKPTVVLAMAFYRNNSDSSYCPDKNSFHFTLTDGKTISLKDIHFNRSTDWAIVTFKDVPSCKSVMYSIDQNHSSGCDSRVRQLKLFKGQAESSVDVTSHFRQFLADICHQAPGAHMPTDAIPPDTAVRTADGKELPAHRFILQMLSKRLGEQAATGTVDLPYHAPIVSAILAFAYGDLDRFDAAAAALDADTVSGVAGFAFPPPDVFKTVGAAPLFIAIAEEIRAPLLKFIAENLIVARIGGATAVPQPVWAYLDAMGVPSLNEKLGALMSRRADLLDKDTVAVLSGEQLCALIDQTVRK